MFQGTTNDMTLAYGGQAPVATLHFGPSMSAPSILAPLESHVVFGDAFVDFVRIVIILKGILTSVL